MAIASTRNEISKSDIPDIIYKFRSGRLESDHSILVPFHTIKANKYNLSISSYKVPSREEVKYKEPELLISNVAGFSGTRNATATYGIEGDDLVGSRDKLEGACS